MVTIATFPLALNPLFGVGVAGGVAVVRHRL